jgi:NAD(P)-dependent dehydrogenase (short-subunit alcohol dehydrogenase family)
MNQQKIAIISGANRGIGKEIAKQLAALDFKVIATGRSLEKIQSISKEIDGDITPVVVDVASTESCDRFSMYLNENFEKVDVLVNNAGIMGNKSISSFDLEQIGKVLNTNLIGAIRLTKAVFPLLSKSNDARIINISSQMGALRNLNGGYAAYRLSKWALNGFTLILASDLNNSNIKVNSICPGWCHTDMGGAGAPKSPAKGAETAVWLATEQSIVNGKFYSDKQIIEW